MQNQNKLLRIKQFVHMPYIYNNSDLGPGLAIKGASANTSTSNHMNSIIRKPVIRLKNIEKYQALNGLASMIGNSSSNNNNSIKGASLNTIDKRNYNHNYSNLKLKLNSNNPIINYVNRMNQKVMEERNRPCTCKNKNGIKGASATNEQEGITALNNLSNMLR